MPTCARSSRRIVRRFADDDAAHFARSLAWELQDDPVLKDAWRTFATYDGLATRMRNTFERFQGAILGLGVLATFLALLHQSLGGAALHWAVVAAPILASVLIAVANRRATGKRWVLLRGAAEAIKVEIYRYRTRTGLYADATCRTVTRRNGLPRWRLGSATSRCSSCRRTSAAARSPLSTGPCRRRCTAPVATMTESARSAQRSTCDPSLRSARLLPGPDRASRSTPEPVPARRGRCRRGGRDRRRRREEIWIGLTTAIGGGAIAHLGYLQADATIVAYNRAATVWPPYSASGRPRAPPRRIQRASKTWSAAARPC